MKEDNMAYFVYAVMAAVAATLAVLWCRLIAAHI